MTARSSATASRAVSAGDAASLADWIDGIVAVPGDDAYPAECAAYNLAIPRRRAGRGSTALLPRLAGPQSGSPLAMVELRPLDGALAREPEIPGAVTGQGAAFQLFCAGVGGPEAELACYERAGQIFRDLAPWQAGGAILNYLGSRDTAPDSVRAAFGPDTYDRLSRIKRQYDPGNLFRLNHNIAPAP